MRKSCLRKYPLRYVFLICFLFVSSLVKAEPQKSHLKLSKNLAILAHVLKELDAYYVHEIDYEALLQTGMHAMLQLLDPYTILIPQEFSASFNALTIGAYEGIGALIGTRQHKHLIFMLYQDTPAYQGGLRVGDELIQINGEDVRDKPIDQIGSLLRGQPNTKVRVVVARYGLPKPLEVELVRAKVNLKNVLYFDQLKQGIGYIKLVNFASQAAEEVRLALEALKARGAQKLILDLRGNPGGILEEAVKIVNLFLDQGLQIVETKSRLKSLAKVYETVATPYDTQMPLVVLIDQGSASAAEIVAGAIQDYDRGILIGKRTYGKGSVQIVKPLCYHAQLKLTTAQYYIPSGRSIQQIDPQPIYHSQGQDKLADKTRITFKTKRGRTVYESNGIDPDIVVEKLKISPITTSLLVQGLIFDYTTIFCAEHDTIPPVQDFQLSATQYQDFVAWLADKDYPYAIEASLNQVLAQAQEGAYPQDIQTQIITLKEQIQHQKVADLQRYSGEIKLMLQESIIERYYFQEGTIKAMLAHDQAIEHACVILEDTKQYQAVLQPS